MEDQVGPELGFGWAVGDAYGGSSTSSTASIVLLKVAWGGKSLAVDFRPPSSGGTTGPYYKSFIGNIKVTMATLGHIFPKEATDRKVIMSGFAWHQGWNDGCNKTMAEEYEQNLANLIRDVRKDLNTPDLPFAIAGTGMLGYEKDPGSSKPHEEDGYFRREDIVKAELKVATYQEFKGTVTTIDTRPYARKAYPASPSDQNYHWMRNAESYWLIGQSLGNAMLGLVNQREQQQASTLATTTEDQRSTAPLMGWRSWNQYGANITQEIMQHIMTGMVDRSRDNTSLCDLGYCDVGLDDNWQACKSPHAAEGMNYHNATGYPIVNTSTFPSLKDMVDYAHSLNLTAAFYGNNCICADHCRNETECDMQTRADVESFIDWGFDTWKLDGCGGEISLELFDKYIKELSPNKKIIVENCHWGLSEQKLKQRHATTSSTNYSDTLIPFDGECPFDFFRSTGDIGLSYGSVLGELNSVEQFRNVSRPGCWAYPDMLMVGIRRKEDGIIGLTKAETRTHFGSWAIVSSPLLLGHDVYDKEVNDHIWDIISNREAIAVNQIYAGDSGGVYETSTETVCLDNCEEILTPLPDISRQSRRELEQSLVIKQKQPQMIPTYKYLSKPLGSGNVAVLLINNKQEEATLEAVFADIPGLPSCESYKVRDIWAQGLHSSNVTDSWSTIVAGHDCAFITVKCT